MLGKVCKCYLWKRRQTTNNDGMVARPCPYELETNSLFPCLGARSQVWYPNCVGMAQMENKKKEDNALEPPKLAPRWYLSKKQQILLLVPSNHFKIAKLITEAPLSFHNSSSKFVMYFDCYIRTHSRSGCELSFCFPGLKVFSRDLLLRLDLLR